MGNYEKGERGGKGGEDRETNKKKRFSHRKDRAQRELVGKRWGK